MPATPPAVAETALDVLRFWWAAGPAAWFRRDDAFDAEVRRVLLPLHDRAMAGTLDDWAGEPAGALALLILLDQVPRNVFRGTPRAFESDGKAVSIALEALRRGFPDAYPPNARAFFYLPFEHAEDIEMQSLSCDLFRAMGDRDLEHYALKHMDPIRRFGRFPHRNAVLGRVSTPEEERYMATGGFSA